MTRWRWGLLLFELFLFVLILVLPQVELPETAFRAGTTPIVAKHQLSGPPTFAVARPVLAALVAFKDRVLVSLTDAPARLDATHRQDVLCVFLC
jgi:hypothetical protein